MFKKLLSRWSTPKNDGIKEISPKLDRFRLEKVFQLQLSNMEGTPKYDLTHQLSIGSEIGNIVIADPTVSPRHATFIIQQDVISIIDHDSITGTIVNGTKIPVGKLIILDEADVIHLGNLEVRITTKSKSVPLEPEPVPEPEPEIPVFEEKAQLEDVTSPAVVIHQKPKKPVVAKKKYKPKKKTSRRWRSTYESYSANSIVRLFAVISDLLISYGLLIIFMPFDEFREFLDFIPTTFNEVVDIDWKSLWDTLNEDFRFFGEMAEDLYTFFSSSFHFGPLFLMFLVVRLLSTLIFGVSISEFCLGMRAHGHALWNRFAGCIRVLIGIVTGPFLIFDLPAIVSKRTFKEFMTFTQVFVPSKLGTTLAILLFVPLSVAFALFAPLIQGLDTPRAIVVKEQLSQRVKVPPTAEAPEVTNVKITQSSSLFKMDLTYEPDKVSILPLVKFQGGQKKLNVSPGLEFLHKDTNTLIGLELFKRFNFRELLSLGLRANYFLVMKFPEIEKFVHTEDSILFRKTNNEKDNLIFANEVIALTKMALELDINNALTVIKEQTPFVKSLIDYKSSLLALLEYKDVSEIGFVKLGNTIFMKVSYPRQKPFDLLIPLTKGEGRVLKVEFPSKEVLPEASSRFYKYTMDETNWITPTTTSVAEIMTPFNVVDFLAEVDLSKKTLDPQQAQALYGYVFEKSLTILKADNPAEYAAWKNSVASVFQFIETLRKGPFELDEVTLKLYQNLLDLSQALESKNTVFFGESVSI